jgi:hypothetical protein
MANSYVTYTANGVTQNYNVPFPFLSRSHVKVYLNFNETTAFTWLSDGQIRFNAAPTDGASILIKRVTPTPPLVDFSPKSRWQTGDLNTATRQAIYIAEEGAEYSSRWYTGTGVPANSLGIEGDMYLNRSNGDVYQKGNSTWGSPVDNLTGPTGPQGATGPQGPQGIQGPQGVAGESVRILGSVGSEGALPSSGNTNGDGYLISGQLYVWNNGSWTNVGSIVGPQGPQGDTGAQGPQGDAGIDGSLWFSGAGVPSGGLGKVPDWYLNETNGDVYEKTGETTWTLRDNLTGPQGPQGVQGNTGATGPQGAPGSKWYAGTGVPATGAHTVGDWYLNDANGDVYEKTEVSTWTLRDNITGPQGLQGDAGPTGDVGPAGSNGTDGRDMGIRYVFSSTTTDADPGNGRIRFNNGTIASVTELYIDNLDDEANSLVNWLDSLDDSTTSSNRGVIHMKPRGSANYILFMVNGAVTDMTGYRKVPVAYIAGALPANNDPLYLWFSRTGNQGASGAGAGDMTKSVYDPNDDGKVASADTADSVPWSGVSSKPTTLSGFGITDAASSTHNHPSTDITDFTEAVQDAINEAFTAGTKTRITITYNDASNLWDFTVPVADWGDITNKPSTFTPSTHSHAISDVTGLQTALDGKAASSHSHAISDVTNLQTSLDAKLALAGGTMTGLLATVASASGGAGLRVPHGSAPSSPVNGDVWTTTTAMLVRLNGTTRTLATTADLSGYSVTGHTHVIADTTGLQTALDAKAPLASPALTGTPTAPTASAWTESTQLATTDNVVETVRTVPLNSQTGTTYTLVLTDAGKFVRLTNAAAITLTIPTNASVAFPINTRIDIGQGGAGQVTVGGGGVTIRSSGSKLKLAGIYSGATLIKVDTDEWWLIGDIVT